MYKQKNLIIILVIVGAFFGACSNISEQATELNQINEADLDESSALSTIGATPLSNQTIFALPERAGPRTQTSGTVPHVQFNVDPVTAVNDELFRRAYLLPGVEDRPTVVSLPGGRGMWLSDEINLVHPEVVLVGREFAHFHTDGSLHLPLPVERAMEVDEKGWGEMHPWAGEREGFDGFVMLYTPLSMEEVDIAFQLIVESYNYVTGATIQASDIE